MRIQWPSHDLTYNNNKKERLKRKDIKKTEREIKEGRCLY